MVYNYYFEIVAIILMLVILLHFLIYRQLPLIRTKVFLWYLCICLTYCVLNVASCIGCQYPDSCPLWLNTLLAMLVFVLAAFACAAFLMYVVLLCDNGAAWQKRVLLLGGIPIIIVIALILTTPLTGWIFSFDEQNRYVSGDLSGLSYLLTIGYALAGMILVLCNRKKVRRHNRMTVVFYSTIIFIGLSIQLFHRQIVLGGITEAIALLLIYVSLQSPGSLVDGMTDRFNGLAFRITIDDKVSHRQKFTVLTLHLNKFNSISSVIGYTNVDSVLEQVGSFLAQIGGEDNTYRTESHVFSIIFPSERETVQKAVSAIQKRFKEKWKAGRLELLLNANIIIAECPKHFETLSEMNALRDYLMECAKNKGTNSLVVADAQLKEQCIRLGNVERAITAAIEKNSIEVYYQPIYSMCEHKMVAAEALARLFDDELGSVSPAEFIPVAEKNGTIVELGRQIFEKCCKFIVEELVPHPELGISSVHVNLSVIQCIQPDMAEQFISSIEKYQVPAGMLNLELTERVTLNATELMREHMQKLGDYGVQFSLDDYGTGSSNCDYLIDYAFSMVKFDKQMMDSYFENDTARIILENAFGLLKKLGLEIVAEGIETKEQVETLREAKMNYIQGYYFAKPAPAEEFLEIVRESNK